MVGWAKSSQAHHPRGRSKMVGLRGLGPPYETDTEFPVVAIVSVHRQGV